MKPVKWIRNGADVGYAYFMGDRTTLTDKEAIRLRDSGHVLIIPDTIHAVPVRQAVIIQAHNRFRANGSRGFQTK